MKIGMHTILGIHAAWLQTHQCLMGNLREAWARKFSLQVQVLTIHYKVCMYCMIHSHVPCIHINPLCGL